MKEEKKKNEIDLKAIGLLALFGRGPCSDGACGKPGSINLIRRFLMEKPPCIETAKLVKKEITDNFGMLFPNLELLSQASGHDVFSTEVAEAYIYGGPLLENVNTTLIDGFLNTLVRAMDIKDQEVREITVKRMKEKLPKKTLFSHLNMLLLNSLLKGTTIQKKNQLRFINSCMVSLGEVKSVDSLDEKKFNVKIELQQFSNLNNLELIKERITVIAEKDIFSEIQVGNIYSAHRGFIIEKLNNTNAKRIDKYNNKIASTYKGRFA